MHLKLLSSVFVYVLHTDRHRYTAIAAIQLNNVNETLMFPWADMSCIIIIFFGLGHSVTVLGNTNKKMCMCENTNKFNDWSCCKNCLFILIKLVFSNHFNLKANLHKCHRQQRRTKCVCASVAAAGFVSIVAPLSFAFSFEILKCLI